VITGLVTLAAFRKPGLRERLLFDPFEILHRKQYERLITSALIHADWMHFGFNAFSLYSFGTNIEFIYGPKILVLIYLSSILGGSLLSLLLHRNHIYRSLGASGGVCGVIFASIFLLPGGSVSIPPFPLQIPAYLYAIGFLVFSFLSHLRQRDNIGHDAHLGGAIFGLLVAAVLEPSLVFASPWMFLAVLALSMVMLWFLIIHPGDLLALNLQINRQSPGSSRSREYDENQKMNSKKTEMDRLLEKVSRQGIKKLSNSDRKRLDELSKEIYGRK
jgi:membrane associated rhomboid family serine protease